MSSPPPKRGRGRPKKTAEAKVAKPVEEKVKVVAEVDSGAEEAVEKPVASKSDQEPGSPKRRGRPRKAAGSKAAAKPKSSEPKKAGKRGRPKKSAEANGDAAEKESEDEEDSPAED